MPAVSSAKPRHVSHGHAHSARLVCQRQRQKGQVLAVVNGTASRIAPARSLREEWLADIDMDYSVFGCAHPHSKWRRQCGGAKPCQTRLPFRLHTNTHFGSLMSATVPPTLPRAVPGAPAEEQAAVFEDDPRVHFDKQTSRWRLEDGDAEFEYEPSRAVWIPVVSLPLPTPQRI